MSEELDFLSLPDDEVPDYVPAQPVAEEDKKDGDRFAGKSEAEIQAILDAEAGVDEDAGDDQPQDQQDDEDDEQDETPDESDDDPEEEQEEEEDDTPPKEESKPASKKENKPAAKPAKKPAPVVDANGFVEKITAPFKANGREIKVETPEEAVRLMQMGANYNSKMAALKPNLQMMRQLEENGLLNPEMIARAIDLLKHKKPEAIARLAKDNNVDPLEVDEKTVADYKPTAVEFDPVKEALNEQLDAIESSPNFQRVMSEVKGYDTETKNLITQHPHVLGYLEQQIGNGAYEIIANEINRRKTLGTLPSNTPFLQAYKLVGDEFQAQGKFDHLGQAAATTPKNDKPTEPVRRAVKPRSAEEQAAVIQRKKAAAPNRGTPAKKLSDIDPLNMSDKEFEAYSAEIQALMR